MLSAVADLKILTGSTNHQKWVHVGQSYAKVLSQKIYDYCLPLINLFGSSASDEVMRNGDGEKVYSWKEKIYLFVDLTGIGRNICAFMQSARQIDPQTVSLMAAGATFLASSIGLVVTGILNVGCCVGYLIEETDEAHQTAYQKLNSDQQKASSWGQIKYTALCVYKVTASLFFKPTTTEETQALLDLSNDNSKLQEKKLNDKVERSFTKFLGAMDVKLYCLMGLGQIAAGITSILYAAGEVVEKAATISGIALGIIYITRGVVKIARGCRIYFQLSEFRDSFKAHMEKLPTDLTVDNWKETDLYKHLNRAELWDGDINNPEVQSISEYASERMDPTYLTEKDSKSNTTLTYTARGILKTTITPGKGGAKATTSTELAEYTTDTQIINYLSRVDKAIYAQKYKQAASIFIGVSMIIGGTGLILADVFSCGLAGSIIAIASSTFFTLAESVFFQNDSGFLLKWGIDHSFQSKYDRLSLHLS